MNILHIDCSPRRESHSRQLSSAVVDKLLSILPDASISRRDLGYEPIPHAGADYAAALATPASLAAAGRSADALVLAEQLIDEVERSDVVVIGTPMNNFTVPSVLKAWIDQILRVGRTMKSTPAGKVGMLQDRPVFVAIASGGVFAGERANQPDFLTPYLTAVLGCIGLNTVHYLPLQGTAFIDEARANELRRSLVATIEPAMVSLVQTSLEQASSR
ncbi:FMN-dependent NADH-azoreductase [Paraburkholderia sp. GV068]|uniref:FMN-dependent NADH-azoreductase n=3 Tax=Burkholderiaceae TaxID=119060 RepID=UPI000D2FB7CE|nr:MULTISPECIES: NAD(P)H-dependent oxidoreductase [Paraburkholderia]AXF11682.1 FMN-dependent NADH-azoreductase [Paraburkholderia graminis]MDR6471287.1 FMN-dependent NADH-azoreductase [Paraburkholderia graminis]PTR03020.1 FMN-dependent NADH-azoreductase [Paraburkholderia sp. GV072]PUB07722.1 FMN-dependent NADH-azoreductase [Paraburkholderia sp. GV068]